jgi:hypothetical protein
MSMPHQSILLGCATCPSLSSPFTTVYPVDVPGTDRFHLPVELTGVDSILLPRLGTYVQSVRRVHCVRYGAFVRLGSFGTACLFGTHIWYLKPPFTPITQITRPFTPFIHMFIRRRSHAVCWPFATAHPSFAFALGAVQVDR